MRQMVNNAWRRIAGIFLAGVFTILPLVITIAVIVWVARFIQGFVGPGTMIGDGLRSLGMPYAQQNNTLAYLIGCLFVIAAIFGVGLVVRLGFRRLLNSMVAPIIRGIPIAGSVYGAATQLVGLLEKKEDSNLQGMSVVYCTFGAEAGTGLLALLPSPERYTIKGRGYFLVYIPTSPVPMTGGLLFVPVDSVEKVDMNVEALMSVYLSMGVTAPDYLKEYVALAQDKPRGQMGEQA